jgi:hypothetical protein
VRGGGPHGVSNPSAEDPHDINGKLASVKKNRRGCGSCLARSDTGARDARGSECRGGIARGWLCCRRRCRNRGADAGGGCRVQKRDSTGADDAPSCGFPYDGYNFRRRSLDRVVWLD